MVSVAARSSEEDSEKRLTFGCFGGADAGAAAGATCVDVSTVRSTGLDIVVVVEVGGVDAEAVMATEGFFFFWFRATDNGRNIIGFPCSLISPASVFWGCGLGSVRDGASLLVGPGLDSWAKVFRISASAVRSNPGSAPVFRLKILRVEGVEAFFSARRFGAGKKELKPEKALPPPPPPSLVLFRAGPSSPASVAVGSGLRSGRATRILRGLPRSTWKSGTVSDFLGFSAGAAGVVSSSTSDVSESE